MVSPTNNSSEPNPIVADVDAEAERLDFNLSLVGDQQEQLDLAEQIQQVNSKRYHDNDDYDEKERLVGLLASLVEDQNDCY
ncbi:MAG: hypothetical protein LBR43_00920 [Spiroplasmataceae bacterium]|jgi:hypothetical protein|nr:hypothetical protein [Spiroplasmataceae bacterium]